MISAALPPPIKTGEDRLLDFQGIHEIDDVERHHGLLAIPKRLSRKKARGAETAQVGDDHPVSLRGQQRSYVDVAVDVVGPALQKNDWRTIGRPVFCVSDIEQARVDLF